MNPNEIMLTLLAAGCVACGCAGEPEGEADTGSEASAAEGTIVEAGDATRDACELLSAAEVAAVHGEPVEARPGGVEGSYRSSCTYGIPGSDWEVMWITVHWRGGKEEWDTQQAGRGIGVRAMGGQEGIDSITRPDPLAGIGDAAYYGGVLPSLVLEDDVLLEFMMPMLRSDREHFPVLAKKAVSRL